MLAKSPASQCINQVVSYHHDVLLAVSYISLMMQGPEDEATNDTGHCRPHSPQPVASNFLVRRVGRSGVERRASEWSTFASSPF